MSTSPPDITELSLSLLSSIPEALIFCDLEGKIRHWNAGAERTFGWSAAEALSQSLDLIIPERMRKAHWDGFEQAIKRGGVKPGRTSMVTRSQHKTKESIYVDMSFEMAKDSSGRLIGSLAVARDCTERFTEEKALRKQLNELLASKSGT